jgi:hypothetical protein
VFHLGERGAVSLADGGDFLFLGMVKFVPLALQVSDVFQHGFELLAGLNGRSGGLRGGMRHGGRRGRLRFKGIGERAGEGMAEALLVKNEEA